MEKDKLKILVVDDEMHVRIIIRAYFAPYDVEILEARDGQEGLDIMKKDDIDLVILDYTMPMMTGQEVLENMVSNQKLEKIPVVLYTAGGFDKEIENQLKSNATAFLEKSSLGDDLIPTVKEILGFRLQKN